jgi:glycerol-3-phosphate dehydrogenase
VRVRDLESREEFEVHARTVVAATGVWMDDIAGLLSGAGPRESAGMQVRASKGVHLVVPRSAITGEAGLILRTQTSVLFVIPWGGHWIIGTTDTDWNLDKAHPAASRTDIEYLLANVNTLLREPLDLADVEGVYAGLRPLVRGAREPSSRISREHTVVAPVPGLVMIAGGKLTTYRVMAKDAIDVAVPDARPCITDRIPLVGADGYLARSNQRALISRRAGISVGRVDHLLGRYGGLVDEVLALLATRPELAQPLEGADDFLTAEVVYAVTHEGARHLDDVLTRRTRISIETFDRGVQAAGPAARLMAGELGWDDARLAEEVDHYLRRVEAERQSQTMLTDQEADEARVSAPDIV